MVVGAFVCSTFKKKKNEEADGRSDGFTTDFAQTWFSFVFWFCFGVGGAARQAAWKKSWSVSAAVTACVASLSRSFDAMGGSCLRDAGALRGRLLRAAQLQSHRALQQQARLISSLELNRGCDPTHAHRCATA